VLPRRRPLFAVTLAALAVLALSGRIVRWQEGFPERLYTPQARLFAEAIEYYDPKRDKALYGIASEPKLAALARENPDYPDDYQVLRMGGSGSWPPDFLLLGDSHARSWIPAFDALALQYGVRGIYFFIWGPPLLGTWNTCQTTLSLRSVGQLTARILDFIQQENIKNVIIANYNHYFLDSILTQAPSHVMACLSDDESPKTPQEAQAIFDRQLQYTVQVMQSLGLTVWMLEDVPDYDESVPRMLTQAARKGALETVGYDLTEYQKRQKTVNESLARLIPLGVRIVRVSETICPNGPCLLFDQEGAFYLDAHHLNAHGALRFKDVLRPMIETIAETKQPAARPEDISKTEEGK
jgi:hypothetical protein